MLYNIQNPALIYTELLFDMYYLLNCLYFDFQKGEKNISNICCISNSMHSSQNTTTSICPPSPTEVCLDDQLLKLHCPLPLCLSAVGLKRKMRFLFWLEYKLHNVTFWFR